MRNYVLNPYQMVKDLRTELRGRQPAGGLRRRDRRLHRGRHPLAADLVDDVVRRVASCSLVTIDAGHHVHRHEPAAFVGAVLAWLA
jgi:pimeloyl-ACP methyl ester carboxylesterase